MRAKRTAATMVKFSPAGEVAQLAASQWGLITTAQAASRGIPRSLLSGMAKSGSLERMDHGIYAVPSSVDELTALRAAWLALEPRRSAEERLRDLVSSGVVSHTSAAGLYRVGDLLDDEPEFTLTHRRQTRRHMRLHRFP